uniref:Uncharacterized protein n=1 Tax=Rhizophora mucronata TaxID=61149 RepID=A0A2P2J052_RHIMU
MQLPFREWYTPFEAGALQAHESPDN